MSRIDSISSRLYLLGARRERIFEGARTAIETRMFPDASQEAPTRIAGRYVPDRLLGLGAFGTVYLAHDLELDRPVALKLLHAELFDESTRERPDLIATEARALARVSHPNVVAVFDVGVWEGKTYLAMEYVPGSNLRAFLSDQHPGLLRLPLLLQAGEGLAAAHDAGIVHRDFKPENVLVGHDGRVRVGDFGLARPLSRFDTDPSPSDASRFAGTPFYMAPEILDGMASDRASDQYAFFVCVYEALYGVRPFEARSLEQLRVLALDRPSRPRQIGDVPARVFDAIAKGMDPDPRCRHPDMHAALAALTAAVERRRRSWAWLGLLAVPGAVGTAIASSGATAEHCDDATASVWTPERSRGLWRSLIASGRPAAITGWPRVEDRIDRWVATWMHEHEQACRVNDRAAVDCLAQQEQELDAVLSVLEERAANPCIADLLRTLGSPTSCDPGDVEAYATLVRRTADLTERSCGYVSDASFIRDAEALAESAEAFPAVASYAWQHVGWARDRLARGGSAVEAYERAHAIADADDVANRIAAARNLAVLVAAVDVRGAERWANEAASLAERSDGLEERCEAAMARARAAVETSDWSRAEEVALAGIEHCGADSFEAADFYGMLATITTQQLRHAEGHRWVEMRRDLEARNWGRDHPRYALAEVGLAVGPAGDPADARRAAEQALAVLERTLGPEHPDTLWTRGRLGVVEMREGNLERARELLESVWAVEQQRPASDDPHRRLLYINDMAHLYGALGDPARELEMAQRGVDHAFEWLGEHPLLGAALSNLGAMLRRAGRLEEALTRFEQAIAVIERLLGPSAPMMAFPLSGRAYTLSDLGREAEALVQFERALAIAEAGGEPVSIAIIATHVAGRLPPSERERAVALAERSLPVLREQGPRQAPAVAAMERLIAGE